MVWGTGPKVCPPAAASLMKMPYLSSSSSDEVLDVGVALGDTTLVGGSPVAALNGCDEGEDALEPDAAEAHPEGVEVPAEHPGGGDES